MKKPTNYAKAEAQLYWHQQVLNTHVDKLTTAQGDSEQPAVELPANLPDAISQHQPIANYPAFLERGFCENQTLPPALLPSPNQRFVLLQQIDEHNVADCPIMQSVPLDGSFRPKETGCKMGLPGDDILPTASLLIADTENNTVIRWDRPPVPASNGGLIETKRVFWASDNLLYVIEQPRDRRTITLLQVDPSSGLSRVILTEQGDTYLQPGPLPFSEPLIRVLPKHNAVIWYSQQNGWGHLYLQRLTTGELINPITTGQRVVTQLHEVDEANAIVYFSACSASNAALNPYYEQLYRVNLDGSDLRLLSSEPAQHDIQSINLNDNSFIDCFSRVDLPTQLVTRNLSDGSIINTLLEPAEAQKAAATFNHPIGFTAKACDQSSDLYGVLYRPSDFDPAQSYPVILAIYGTPHECVVPLRYAESSNKVRDIYRSLAELGFIVVIVDPRGTPLRGKAFHDVAYKNLHNGGGIDDQVAALKQLGERHPWMDMTRVGITGHSGGGYASARAMMTHADFFKVCVSSAGNHDQRLYVAGWAETFHGLVEGDNYSVFENDPLIPKLTGKLLLVHGDADANVHIAHTLQLVDKLIHHNKDFDLLVLPNRGHLHMQDTYFIRRLWDYFVEHLLGEQPPKDYAIAAPITLTTD